MKYLINKILRIRTLIGKYFPHLKKKNDEFVCYDSDELCELCIKAVIVLKKQNNPEYNELIAKLEWCINSFKHDYNPVGLVEQARIAYGAIKKDLLIKN